MLFGERGLNLRTYFSPAITSLNFVTGDERVSDVLADIPSRSLDTLDRALLHPLRVGAHAAFGMQLLAASTTPAAHSR